MPFLGIYDEEALNMGRMTGLAWMFGRTYSTPETQVNRNLYYRYLNIFVQRRANLNIKLIFTVHSAGALHFHHHQTP